MKRFSTLSALPIMVLPAISSSNWQWGLVLACTVVMALVALTSRLILVKKMKTILTIAFFLNMGLVHNLSAQLSGVVYFDGNNSGTKETVEIGYSHATVTAYDALGGVFSAITANNGTYTIAGTSAGTTYRIELSLPSGYNDGAFGSSSGTSVQFAAGNASNVNFGMYLPDKCNPDAIVRVVTGMGLEDGDYSVKSWDFVTDRRPVNSMGSNGTTTPHTEDITATQVGVPFGVSTQKKTGLLYFSTIAATLTDVFPGAPDGQDAIYVADYTGPNKTFMGYKFLTKLSSYGISTAALNPIANETGEYGLGGCSISSDGNSLYVINMGKGNLVKIDISNITFASIPSGGYTNLSVTEIPITGAACSNGTFRPSALEFQAGSLYIVGVCDASAASSSFSDLRLRGLKMNVIDNTFTQVLDYDLSTFTGGGLRAPGWPQRKWSTTWLGDDKDDSDGEVQPIIPSIAFDDDGAMIIGVTNRQVFVDGESDRETGYMLRTWRESNGSFTVESGGVSGPYTSTAKGSSTNSGGQSGYYDGSDDPSTAGPGDDWFFEVGRTSSHPYLYNGGAMVVPGTGLVLGGFGDPGNPSTQTGGRYLDYKTGVALYGTSMVGQKASVMGDVEAVCNVPPIEVGNRVWLDANSNGIQDGGEPGIGNITVELYQGSNLLATATTDTDGNYIFSSETKSSTASLIYSIGALSQLTSYSIRIPDVQGTNKQSDLGDNTLTTSNVSGTANDETDKIDSDGVLSGDNAEVVFTTGAFGTNLHVFDFGFREAPCALTINSATPTACVPATNTYNLAVTVSYTNPPTGDITINVGGTDYTFTPDGTSPDTYTVIGLTSNGTQDIDVSATFVGDAACTDALIDAYDAPASCSPPFVACGDIPVIWLVDEDQAAPSMHLWSFKDYNDATNTGTDYGRVTYIDPITGDTTAFATSSAHGDLESMAVNQSTGQAYFLTASKIAGGPSGGQTLFTYNLNDAAANKGKIALTVIGHIQRPHSWAAEVLALYNNHLYLADPVTGNQNTDTSTDILMSIDLAALNSDVMQNTIPTIIGPIQGLGQVNNYVDGMEILPDGTLYTVDGTDDHLYRVSLATGAILEVVDNNIPGGIDPLADVETIVWDPVNSKLIGADNELQQFVDLTLDGINGNNIVTSPYIGTPGIFNLVDFEGSAMFVMCCDLTVNSAIPSTCDVNGQYTLSVDVTYTNVSGYITINGQSFTPSGVTGRDTFVLVLLTADGAVDVDVTAQSITEVTCSSTLVDAYDAPASCACNLSATTSGTDVLCNGGTDGTATVTASGNTSVVTYLWSNGGTTATISNLAAGTYNVTVTESANCTAVASYTVTEPTALAPVCDATDVTTTGGSDGTASVSVSGGTPSYTYLWNTGATTASVSGLAAGTYHVTVTDANGCTSTCASTVNEPGCALSLSETNVDVLCNGGMTGSIDVTVSGAQGSVSYVWSDGATTEDRSGLAAGTYSVTATDAGNCQDILSVEISEPTALAPVCDATDVTTTGGSDGTASVSVSGGTPSYTYLWNTGATTASVSGLAAGTYHVTVTDANGCTSTCASTVNEPGCGLSLSETNVDVLCNGGMTGSIDVTVSGAQGSVSYVWSDGATTEDRSGLAAGTYSVTATDAGNCQDILSVEISEPTALAPVCSATDVTTTGGSDGTASVSVSGGTPSYTYLWNTGATTASVSGLAAGTYNVTVTDANGCTSTCASAINEPSPLGSIGNYVWIDTNGDGIQNEPASNGVNGVTVILWSTGADGVIGGGDDVQLATTITANDPSGNPGYYEFTGLPAGSYYVQFPTNVTGGNGLTTQDGTPQTDGNSDANIATGFSNIVVLNPANGGQDQNNTTIDAGYLPVLGSIGNYVWIDTNGDGIQNEPATNGVNGVTVILWSPGPDGLIGGGDDVSLGTVVTANDPSGNPGYYEFTGLLAGSYYVQFPTNVTGGNGLTTQDGTPQTDGNSDANIATGFSNLVVLNPANGGLDQNNPTIDAGYLPVLGSIGNYVWIDTNGDGIQNEPASNGVNGVTVILWSPGPDSVIGGGDDVQLATTITANDPSGNPGYYEFTGLPAGSYYVQFPTNVTGGDGLTTQDGTPQTDGNSDANIATGFSNIVVLNPANGGQDQNNTTIDAGYLPVLGSIGNYVWIDTNGDGIQNEPATNGVNGVTVILWSPGPDGLIGGGDDVSLGTVVTANDPSGNPGYYEFTGLLAGSYYVQFPTNVTGGNGLTTQDGTPQTDGNSDANIATGFSNLVVLNPANGGLDQNNPTIDAGYLPVLGSIGNYVWIDTNGDGIQNEPASNGVNGVTVILWSPGPDSVIGGGDDVQLATTITANDPSGNPGYYEFTGLPAGSYYVQFPTNVTGGDGLTTQDGTPQTDGNSDANIATGFSNLVVLNPANGGLDQNNPTIDAGYLPVLGSIGNYVWIDTNGDGIQNEPASNGVNGVTVILWSTGADGVIGGGDDVQLATTITANDPSGNPGYYEFTGLPAGSYYVQFPTNVTGGNGLTTQDGTPQTDGNSDANIATGFSNIVVLNPANGGQDQNNTTIDAGYLPVLGSIGNYVWIDTNGDGIQNEPATNGVNGVTVILWSPGPDGLIGGGDDVSLGTVVTANDPSGNPGYYEFTGLLAGSYYVQFPTDVIGGDGLTTQTGTPQTDGNSDANTTTGLSPLVVLNPASGGLDQDNPTIDAGYLPQLNIQPDTLYVTIPVTETTGPLCPTADDIAGYETVEVVVCESGSVVDYGTFTTDANGCVLYTAGSIQGAFVDTLCIIGIDSLGNQDTTVWIISITPEPDTLHITIPTDSTTVPLCPTADNNEGTETIDVVVCESGSVVDYGTFTTDANGCVLYTAGGLPGNNVDTICVISIDSLGNQDTTTYIITITPNCLYTIYPICLGESYAITADPGYVSYQWYVDNGSGPQAILNATSQEYIVTMPGSYSWTGTNSVCTVNSCCSIEFEWGSCVIQPDTLYVTIPVTETTGPLCPTADDIAGYETVEVVVCESGSVVDYGTFTTDANGCVLYTAGSIQGAFVDTLCIIGIDSLGNQDTTVWIISITPEPDTFYVSIPEDSTTVSLCPTADNNEGTETIEVVVCESGTLDYGTFTTDANGCVLYTAGSTSGNNVDTICVISIDSLGNQDTTTYIITITPNPLGSIGNYVWIDTNGDGIQNEPASNGVNGVTVILWSAGADGVIGGGDDVQLATTVTANDPSGNPGYYEFTGLPAGSYYVQFPTNVVGGNGLTTQDGTPQTDGNSDVSVATGLSAVIVLNPANGGLDQNNPTIDAGYLPQLNIQPDTLYVTIPVTETTGPLCPTADDIAGYETVEVVVCESGSVVDYGTFTTDANGCVLYTAGSIQGAFVDTLCIIGIDSLGNQDTTVWIISITPEPDTFYVSIPEDSTTVSLCPTADNNEGTETIEVVVCESGTLDYGTFTTDANGCVLYTAGSTSGNNVDTICVISIDSLGNQDTTTYIITITPNPLGSIGNYVWIDTNGDGIQNEPASNGVNGVTVILWSAGADGVIGGGDDVQLATTVTANDPSGNPGYYEFTGLPAGSYYVQFPTNVVGGNGLTTQDGTPQTDGNSDVSVATGLSAVIVLNPANGGLDQNNPTIDAGYLPACIKPILTAGNVECNGATYSVDFYSSTTNVSVSAGVLGAGVITGIPVGTDVVITASTGIGCSNTITVSSPSDCGGTCTTPSLTAGQPLCDGATYTVSITVSTGATVSVSAGTLSGNVISGIPVGTNVTVTATDGTCVSSVTVTSPASCVDPCENPAMTLSGPVCTDNGTTYAVNFTATSGATVSASAGTVGAGVISGIPAGTDVTVTVSIAGCPDKSVVVPAPTNCATCIKPILTAGNVECNGATYSVDFYSSTTNVSVSAGVLGAGVITGIPVGTDVVITASTGIGCSNTITVSSPSDCGGTCTTPSLTAGQPLCDGATYTVSITVSTGATVSVSAGTLSGNVISGIPVGTNVTVTATDGTCVASVTVTSPASCVDPCENPAMTLSGPVCTDNGTTYAVNFTATSGATVSASAGTVGAGVISGIPAGTDVTVTVSIAGCPDKSVVVPAPTNCATCIKPILTAGNVECSGATYSVDFYSSTTNVSVSAGVLGAGVITGIPVGTDVVITASIGIGCSNTITVSSPSDCGGTCTTPSLTAGQPLCDGATYTVSITVSTGATVSVSAGTLSGNVISGIPVGTNVTVTATDGTCVASVTVTSPASCVDPCENPAMTLSGPVCTDNGTTYAVNFTATSGATVSASAGTVGAGVISGIPAGTDVTVTVSIAGCPDKSVVVPAPTNCATCIKPILTAGNVECNGATYSVDFYSSTTNVSVSAGVLGAGVITGIPVGTDVVITASTGIGCSNTITVSSPSDCGGTCTTPSLTAGQPLCDGATYTVSITVSTGATVSVSAGTLSGNVISGIPVGTNVTVTATDGTCVASVTVTSPASCVDPCENPAMTLSGPVCTDNGTTYAVNFTATSGATVSASAGTVGAGVISGIPAGTDVTVTVSIAGCPDKSVVVPAPTNCATCIKPILTAGNVECSGATYSVDFYSSTTNVSVSAGVLGAGVITGIPVGTDVVITASTGIGCSNTITVSSPSDCGGTCTTPSLTAGQPLCDGATYTVSITVSTGATVSVSAGTLSGNVISGIPVGTNVTVTATDGTCVASVTVTSPASCVDPCENPAMTLSGPVCTDNGTTYAVNFTATSGATVSASAGTVGAGVISGIPAGTDVTVTVSIAGCPDKSVVVPAPTNCATCIKPILTAGNVECSGATYSVDFYSSTTNVSVSAGVLGAGVITGIPVGTDVVITASTGIGCSNTITVSSPSDCGGTCTTPSLTAGQPLCDGATYTVSITVSTGATVSVSAGTLSGNVISGIPVGTNVTVTATDGTCVASVTVTSPASCVDPCENPAMTLSGPVCTDNGTTYAVNFTATSGATVSASAGTVGAGVISGIPAGTDVTVTVSIAGCPDKSVVVPAPTNCTQLGSISNYVWLDTNGDGLQNEPASNGINGIVVELLSPGPDGIIGTADDYIIATTTTANDVNGNPGYYIFDGLPSGTYYVHFGTTYNGGNLTTANQANQTDGNSDANQLTGNSGLIVINANGTGQDRDNTTIDAGYLEPGCEPVICVPIQVIKN